MKRSEINAAVKEAKAAFRRHQWALPPNPRWDVTDFGLGNFTKYGLVLVNLDAELHLDPAPEPLLAPLQGCSWELSWSSEDPRYGGTGTPPVYGEENWRLPGRIAVLLQPAPAEEPAVVEHAPMAEGHD